jgi:positive regulator of sigma E activity
MQSEARVVAVDSGDVWVEIPERQASCGSCSSSGSCHSNPLAGSNGPRRIKLANRIGAQVGDTVHLSVADGRVLRASWLSYLLPAILAIAGAAFGQSIGNDAGALIGTVAGLVVGFVNLRLAGSRMSAGQPILSLERPATKGACHFSE